MRAWVQDVYGSAEVMGLADVPEPVPGTGEVLVRVAAVSLNAADWHIMRGEPRVARLDRTNFGRRRPKQPIRGRDVAGTVVAVGPGVEDWQVGDEVLGEHEGTLAELVAVPASCLARRPEAVGVVEAAAATTAVTCLDAGGVGAGTRLLVVGASGGVGTFAVQLAVARGAEVTGVCSSRNLDMVTSLGASAVLDYTRGEVERSTTTYDVVLDLVGNRSLRDLRRLVAPRGRLVLAGGGNPGEGGYLGPIGLFARGALLGRLLGMRVTVPFAKPDAARLAELVGMVERGELRPVVERVYPFEDGAAALRHLEVDHARGKVVVAVAAAPGEKVDPGAEPPSPA
ncbi:NAD(P)-dependent alcohol dehydrogenase [Nocardioides sp.]|uniref:NAD(P)-dependent alcohol dehydrogenase n=1 Tax=Nocardioides sp. TaxID=35761 RepID=UPI002635AAE8|nr:NAD(P)-dependent alcohol dehydrogenase [Nocardioides sp.]